MINSTVQRKLSKWNHPNRTVQTNPLMSKNKCPNRIVETELSEQNIQNGSLKIKHSKLNPQNRHLKMEPSKQNPQTEPSKKNP